MSRDYGTVIFEGKEYTLTQDTYVNNYGTGGEVRYYASAIDTEGNKYLVAWDTTEKWNLANELFNLELRAESEELSEEDTERLNELSEMVLVSIEDESNACDWDEPVEVRLTEEV